jgi:Protein of unknown function (DUF3421)
VKDKMMNKKYVSGWLTALGIATVSLGSLVAMTEPALAEHRWVAGSNGSVPAGAIQSGNDGADPLYVCKTNRGNGKLHSRYKRCYVPYGGKEQEFTTYEVLVGNNMRWVPMTGSVSQYVVMGVVDNGSQMYVCRANLRSGVTPGKYYVPHKKCYVSYGGKEYGNTSSEILIDQPMALTTSKDYPLGVKYLLANNEMVKVAIKTVWDEGGKGIAQQKISEAIGGKQISKGVNVYGQNVNLEDIRSTGIQFDANTNQVILQLSTTGDTTFRTTTDTVFGSYGDPSFRVSFDLNVTIKISTATNRVTVDDITVGVVGRGFNGTNAVGTVIESVKDFTTKGRFSQEIISRINANYSVKNQLSSYVKSAIELHVPLVVLNKK